VGSVVRNRLSRSGGFSIVEGVVAVMILVVVAAMAFPYVSRGDAREDGGSHSDTPDWMQPVPSAGETHSSTADWMGVDPSAGDRDAQVEVRDVLLAQKAYWLETGNYTATAAHITALNPAVRIASSPASGVVIALSESSSDTVCISRRSASGTTFSVWEDSMVGTYYGASDLSSGPCPTAPPASYAQGGW